MQNGNSMLGTKDIEKVMIRVCEGLGIVPLSRIYLPDDFPEGVSERIVIHVKNQTRGDIFYKGFVEVNAIVPDDNEKAKHERLGDIEHIFDEAFKYDTVGEYNGETYRYGLYSMETLCDQDAHYHYVNARLTFETLNI